MSPKNPPGFSGGKLHHTTAASGSARLMQQPKGEQHQMNTKAEIHVSCPGERLGVQAAPAALPCPLLRASGRPAEDARVCTGLSSPARLLGWDAPGLLLQRCYTTAVMKKIQLQKLFVSASAPVSIRETRAAMVQRLPAGLGRADCLPGGWLLFAATGAEEFPGDEKKSQGSFIE